MTCDLWPLYTHIQIKNFPKVTSFPSICPYLSVTAADALAVGAEGGDQVGGGQETVLVGVHDAKSLLELLDGGVGERFEDVSFLRHLVMCW